MSNMAAKLNALLEEVSIEEIIHRKKMDIIRTSKSYTENEKEEDN